MSIHPVPDHGDWRAPGTEPAASPVVTQTLADLTAALDDAGGISLVGLSDSDVARLLDGLTAATGRLTEAVTRTVAEADHRRLGDEIGARTTGAWWAGRARLTRPEAHRLVALGRSLESEASTPIRKALAAGALKTDQAQVIVRALDALPDDLDPDVRSRARDHLLELAADHDAHALRRLGKAILDTVAPEVGESHEQRVLEREEAKAAASAWFSMVDDGHGRVHGRFTLPSHQGTMLRQALHALANPRRHDAEDLKDQKGAWLSTPERLGVAFGDYIERYPADGLPQAGGVNATVVVTLDLDTLISGLGAATLSDGSRISAGTARRLACEAGILPAVLGGASLPLDIGRTQRLHTRAQRVALGLRDQGCTAEGCGLPPTACQAHHDHPWSRGGRTSVAKGRLLCTRHHRLAHDRHYDMRIRADNTVTFHRRR